MPELAHRVNSAHTTTVCVVATMWAAPPSVARALREMLPERREAAGFGVGTDGNEAEAWQNAGLSREAVFVTFLRYILAGLGRGCK